MDQKEYIESGVLEMYASGGLSSSEAREVETMAASHPEIAVELIKISDTVAKYASAFEMHPRPALRKLILDQVEKSVQAKKEKMLELKSEKNQSASSYTYKYLLAACLASLVISTFASYFFYSRWSESEDKNLTLLHEKTTLAVNYTQVKNVFDKTYSDLLIMRDMNIKMVSLHSFDTTQKYEARVYWNIRTRESYLDVLSLPMPQAGMQYQLWAMADGQPVDAGMIDMNDDANIHRMKKIYDADGWAITLEPMGGSAVPTLTSVMLKSNG
jgi:anti-sigma-K factor RskA